MLFSSFILPEKQEVSTNGAEVIYQNSNMEVLDERTEMIVQQTEGYLHHIFVVVDPCELNCRFHKEAHIPMH